MSYETKEHEKLKALAKQILLKKGFLEKEIFMEYSVLHTGDSIFFDNTKVEPNLIVRRGIVADVVGIKKISYNRWKTVAVECGRTPSDRLAQLLLFFDEVYYIPFVKTLEKADILPE